jgi:U32 family peptidase
VVAPVSSTVLLRDRSGAEHPLRADLGCRNTLFNARAQSAAEAIPLCFEHGVSRMRVELLDDDPSTARRRVGLYLDALQGRWPVVNSGNGNSWRAASA